MPRILSVFALSCCALSLGACSTVPNLPSEDEMPVQLIMLHTTCELRAAFIALSADPKYKDFKADQWSINISLTPKVDTSLQASLGWTGRTTNMKALRLWTWTLGTSPGLRGDIEGHRDGAVTFPLSSKQLLDVPKYPLVGCDDVRRSDPTLSQYLGIREWLERTVPTDDNGLAKLTNIDKPTFNSEIVVKFDAGNVGASYFVPNGWTYSAALAGTARRDETLSISMTPDPKVKHVETLPKGVIKKLAAGTGERISAAAQSRLDQIQLEQTLRNLRIQQE